MHLRLILKHSYFISNVKPRFFIPHFAQLLTGCCYGNRKDKKLTKKSKDYVATLTLLSYFYPVKLSARKVVY